MKLTKCKEVIFANIKEQKIMHPTGCIKYCYDVTFTIEKEYKLLGITIKKAEEVETLPFVFKSLDIAKDYCRIHPKVVSDIFVSNDNYPTPHFAKYFTYRLVANDKILGFIKWHKDYVTYVESGSIKKIEKSIYPVVDKFVKYIEVRNYVYVDSANDVIFLYQHDLLSDAMNDEEMYGNGKSNTTKEWNFKLVKE